jgi:hypothetical protein
VEEPGCGCGSGNRRRARRYPRGRQTTQYDRFLSNRRWLWSYRPAGNRIDKVASGSYQYACGQSV